LYSCDNLKITTIEGIGNKSTSYNEIQKRLVKNNGTQCGYCTPGFVMNMYSLLLEDQKPSKSKIESSFDGNICRCTGYRSILDSMKSFAVDENPIDIEELNSLKCLNHATSCNHKNKIPVDYNKNVHIIKENNSEWFVPKNMNDLYSLLTQYQNQNYRIVASNTSVGVYKNEGPFQSYINIRNIPDLYKLTKTPSTITIGSQFTLSKLIKIFDNFAQTSGFEYLNEISAYLNRIGNVSVRNVATWAGNLEMKYNHPDFASDVFTILETINATINLVGPSVSTPTTEVSPSKYLQTPHKGKIIHSMAIKSFNNLNTVIKTYKIMPRSQNSHAYVNAGFNFTFVNMNSLEIESCSIVFGGISKNFIHANQTERFLLKKSLSDESILNEAFKILNDELNPEDDPVVFYNKFLLYIYNQIFFYD
jgi:xanthine dehydrogenase/oxidase